MYTEITKKNILDIANNYYKYFLNLQNVKGIGMGYKCINGIFTKEICIHVLVKKKVNKSYLSSNNIIPKTYMGINTDVLETGISEICKDINRDKVRPLKGGYGIAIRDETGYWHNGTLGCIATHIVNEKREYYILSNNHVIANNNDAPIGTSIIQPSEKHWGHSINDIVAHLSTFKPINFKEGAENFMDAAIAKISNKELISSNIGENDKLKGLVEPELNMKIKKHGMTSGLTTGIITTVGLTESITFSETKSVIFKNQIKANLYNKKGDSGSIILNESNEAVGLFFAGNTDDNTATFSDIQSILDTFNIELYKG